MSAAERRWLMAFRSCLLPTDDSAMPQTARAADATHFPSAMLAEQPGPEAHGTVELE
jgi:hypothetical protein